MNLEVFSSAERLQRYLSCMIPPSYEVVVEFVDHQKINGSRDGYLVRITSPKTKETGHFITWKDLENRDELSQQILSWREHNESVSLRAALNKDSWSGDTEEESFYSWAEAIIGETHVVSPRS